MKISTAASIKESILTCTQKLDESVRTVQESCEPRLAAIFRRLVGQAMGRVFTDVLSPVYREFPSLEPEDLKSSRLKPDAGPNLSAELASELLALTGDVKGRLEASAGDVGANESELEEQQFRKRLAGALDALDDIEKFIHRTSE